MTISNTFQEEYDMAAIQGFLGYFGKLAELPASYNRLQAELEQTNARLTEIAEQVRTLTQQVSDKTKALEEAQAELRHTSDWLKASRESNTLLREQIRTHGTELARARSEVETSQARVREHEHTIAEHVDTIDRHAGTIADQRQEIAQLKARIARMVRVANGQDDEVPTVDKIMAGQTVVFHDPPQAQEVPANPLANVGAEASGSTEAASVGTVTDRTTSQTPVSVEYDPGMAGEEERVGGVSGLPPFRPFANAATTDPSGDPRPSQSTPDGRYDPDLDPRYNFA